MLFKRILATASALAITVAIAVPFTAEATEYHTFEELLPMSEEEICALSEEYADAYSRGKYFYSICTIDTPCVRVFFEDDTVPVENVLNELELPRELISGEIQDYDMAIFDKASGKNCNALFDMTLSSEGYNDISGEEAYAKAWTAISLNPKLLSSYIDAPYAAPYAETVCTFSQLLTMSNDEIKQLSVEYSNDGKSGRRLRELQLHRKRAYK